GAVAGVIYTRNTGNDLPGVELRVDATNHFYFGTNANTWIQSTGVYNDNQLHIAMLRRQGRHLDIRVDGAPSGTPMDVDPIDASAVGVPGFVGGSESIEYLKGDIMSLLGFDATLDDAAVSKVETQLKAYYGL
ncbi:MAG TPA: hypothetical protein VNO21_11080, partial [Polyangiaceae bacterium]|nr:hypothetical protein [Polyangiaceae bacterium]